MGRPLDRQCLNMKPSRLGGFRGVGMETLAIPSGVTLFLIFLAAAAFKLRDIDLTAEHLADFEVIPARLLTVAAVFLCVWELTVSFLLVWKPSIGALAAGASLIAFGAVVAGSWAKGLRDITCGCFGQMGEAPIGWHLVFRNLCLAMLAIPVSHVVRWSEARFSVAGVVVVGLFLSIAWISSEFLRLLNVLSVKRPAPTLAAEI